VDNSPLGSPKLGGEGRRVVTTNLAGVMTMDPRIRGALQSLMRERYLAAKNAYRGIPRPRDVPRAHASGLDPDRILIAGTDSATGWGVTSHDLALPGQLARELASVTGRGVDVNLLCDPDGVGIDAVIRLLHDRELREFDAVVVIVGVVDAANLMQESVWAARVGELFDILDAATAPTTPIVIMGIPALSSLSVFDVPRGGTVDASVARLNAATAALCERGSRNHYFELPEIPRDETSAADRYRTAEDYRRLARQLAAFLTPLLQSIGRARNGALAARQEAQGTGRRLDAIHALHILDSAPEERFDLIVRKAQQYFGVKSAAFTLIDEDRQWNKSTVGFDDDEIPLADSFCATTIRAARPFVVMDSLVDRRAPSGTPFRFYAGYPVESPDGVRIGALCVFDPEPHEVTDFDVAVLRYLAMLVQDELAQPLAAIRAN
jgi:hypothetical protein